MSITLYENVLDDTEILSILNSEKVVESRLLLETKTKVQFTAQLPDTIKQKILTRIGLDLTSISDIPMRWVREDTAPHEDLGERDFSNTYLIYLTDSEGFFVINDTNYEIKKGSAFVFNEGLLHGNTDTNGVPRLSLGPMSEFGFPVGPAVPNVITYYSSQYNAINDIDSQTTGQNVVVANSALPTPFPGIGNVTSWIIYYISAGPPNVGDVIYAGETFVGPQILVYPNIVCFLEGSKILCQVDQKDVYIPIQDIKKGMLVKTNLDGYKAVDTIGHTKMYNSIGASSRPKTCLYKCTKEKYPELIEDLYITGCHSILVDDITDEQRKSIIEQFGRIYITSQKYRLMACIDERAEAFTKEGLFPIWHLALENNNYYSNYGVYANGLLVETASKRYLNELSGMELN
jgi:hypothetical protein